MGKIENRKIAETLMNDDRLELNHVIVLGLYLNNPNISNNEILKKTKLSEPLGNSITEHYAI